MSRRLASLLAAATLLLGVAVTAGFDDPVQAQTKPDRRVELRAQIGSPDAFIVTADEIDGELVRFESWIYYESETQFDFADGEVLWSVALDPLPDGSLLPLQYDPDMFELLASADDVRALLPDVELTEVGIKEKAIPKGIFLAGEQLLLGFVDDKLIYAESMALVPEEP